MNNSDKINISENELEKRLRQVDKSAVERKLREMGMGDIADKLRRTDNEEILRMVRSNPDILKKVNQMMGGK
ncbi:MAG: hypothetical protein IJ460_02015 [Clostridia bacterium]|nr:hypothetical protein [Clostridia bacterium]